MSRSLPCSVAVLIAIWALMVPMAPGAQEPKEPKIIASASDPDASLVKLKQVDSGVVIRSVHELAAHSPKPDSAKDPKVQKTMESELAQRLKVERIDWDKQMVLVVQGQPTKGSHGSIKFEPLKISDNVLTVRWKQEERATLVTWLGPPTGFALIERSEAKVTFVPPPPVKK